MSFDQVRDHYGFLSLMSQGFGWSAHPRRIALIRRLDARYRDPYGFCAMQGDVLAGFVGALEVPVRTRDRGDEAAGGLFAIATRPDFARQGIARRLIRHAHRLFRERGYRFSFLYTRRSLVAYSLYGSLGYREVPGSRVPRAVRMFRPRKSARRRPVRPGPGDFRRAYRLFEQAMTGRTGFAPRQPGWLSVLVRTGALKPDCLISERDGYAVVLDGQDTTYLLECIATSRAGFARLIDRARNRGQSNIVVRQVHDPVLQDVCREQGFRFESSTYVVLMGRPLGRSSLSTAFGPGFYNTAIDAF